MQNSNEKELLVGLFNSQLNNIKLSGPIEEYVKLEINLAKAEYLYNKKNAIERLTDVYFYLNGSEDIVVFLQRNGIYNCRADRN